MKALCAACALALWTAAGAQAVAAQAVPVAVQPSGPQVPANLLRISLVFAQLVGEPVLPRLELRQANGKVIDKPFLDQELWSPSGKVLTVLLDPARVKSGLIAHDTFGPVLRDGELVVLMLDGEAIKRWKIGADDHDGPKPALWKLGNARAHTREPLVAELDAPIDGRDVEYLVVADCQGKRVAGRAVLLDGERRWSFLPAVPWRAGTYQLAVFSQLEDASGNRMGGHFEETAGTQRPSTDTVLTFTVR